MRVRVLGVLLVAVSTVSLHAHAATPINVTAVNVAGQAVVWSKPGNTFVLKAKATSLPVKVTVTCLQIERFESSAGLPLHVPLSATQVNAAVKAGGVTYYVLFQSFAQRGNMNRQAVTALGVSTNVVPTNPCGANPNLRSAAGIAIYG
jgi:hypothetical protein